LAPTVGSLGIGTMDSKAFSLLANSNSKVNGNQGTSKAIDFQPHPPTLTPVFANLDQEMDLMIESLNFCVGSLRTTCLSDLMKSGLSVVKTASTAMSESSVGSSSEVISLSALRQLIFFRKYN
jgi:hypothetical protein